MSKPHIRFLNGSSPAARTEMGRISSEILKSFLEEEIEELQHKLRYSEGGDTKLIQGALRALDDIRDLLS